MKKVFKGGFYQWRWFDHLLVLFLPPNMTAAIQPMDMGIIAKFKTHYRSFFLKRRMKELEDDGVSERKINLLDASKMASLS